jgi:hypothetical protein
VQGANIMVSTGTIAAIALDRYITIVRHSPCNSGAGGSSDNPEKTRVVISILLVSVFVSLVNCAAKALFRKFQSKKVSRNFVYRRVFTFISLSAKASLY